MHAKEVDADFRCTALSHRLTHYLLSSWPLVQAKNALSLAPAAGACMCIAEVWGEVESQAKAAGFGDQLGGFLASCDIKVSGRGC